MSFATIQKGRIFENSSCVLLARVVGTDGVPVAIADVETIDVKVYDGKTLVASPEFTVADVVYDELQLDDRWTADNTGYDLALLMPGSCFPEGDKSYRVEAKITPVDGSDGNTAFYVVWELRTIAVRSE